MIDLHLTFSPFEFHVLRSTCIYLHINIMDGIGIKMNCQVCHKNIILSINIYILIMQIIQNDYLYCYCQHWSLILSRSMFIYNNAFN